MPAGPSAVTIREVGEARGGEIGDGGEAASPPSLVGRGDVDIMKSLTKSMTAVAGEAASEDEEEREEEGRRDAPLKICTGLDADMRGEGEVGTFSSSTRVLVKGAESDDMGDAGAGGLSARSISASHCALFCAV